MTKTKAVVIPVTPFQQNCTLLWCDGPKPGRPGRRANKSLPFC